MTEFEIKLLKRLESIDHTLALGLFFICMILLGIELSIGFHK